MSYVVKNSYNFYLFWFILFKYYLYYFFVFISGFYISYLFIFLFWMVMYMLNVFVVVLNYFEDDLCRLVCDRSL